MKDLHPDNYEHGPIGEVSRLFIRKFFELPSVCEVDVDVFIHEAMTSCAASILSQVLLKKYGEEKRDEVIRIFKDMSEGKEDARGKIKELIDDGVVHSLTHHMIPHSTAAINCLLGRFDIDLEIEMSTISSEKIRREFGPETKGNC